MERLYLNGAWANFVFSETVFEGKINGVSKLGKLQIEMKSCETKEFDLKEVSFADNV